MLIKGGHEEGDALADALIEEDNMTSWQGQRIDTTSTHGTGCTLASGIAFTSAQGSACPKRVERARLFVRMALHEAPGLGHGHGPLGHQSVRLDTGLGLRLNQVTVTGKDYQKMVDFYRKLGLRQIVDSPENHYARFEAGGATFSIQCDPEAEIGETVAVYFECDDLDERVERLARQGMPFEHGPRNQPWMWREARLRDPSGNTIFLYRAGEPAAPPGGARIPPVRLEEATGKWKGMDCSPWLTCSGQPMLQSYPQKICFGSSTEDWLANILANREAALFQARTPYPQPLARSGRGGLRAARRTGSCRRRGARPREIPTRIDDPKKLDLDTREAI